MDPIADMLVRIGNANHKLKESVDVPASKIKGEVARVLKDEGFISGFRTMRENGRPVIRLNLKYSGNKGRVIQGVRRISKPSLRIYRSHDKIPSDQNGLGTAIVSTSKGVMAGQEAKEKKLGGEVLCFVW